MGKSQRISRHQVSRRRVISQKINPRHIFGYELLLDCYGCKPGVCDDLAHCYKFLDTLVDFIGMEKQEEPTLFRTDRKRFPGKEGLSGWVPLAQSSIVIHTLSRHNFISLDVYSCGKFSPEKVRKYVQKFFAPATMEQQLVLRGKKYYAVGVPRRGALATKSF